MDDYFKKWDLKWENLCSVCTDGAPAMIGARLVFAKRLKALAPGAMSVHCMIHCQALASQTLPSDLQSALDIAIKMVNFVKKSVLNTRLFSKLCKDMSADYTTLLHQYKYALAFKRQHAVQTVSIARKISRVCWQAKTRICNFLQ